MLRCVAIDDDEGPGEGKMAAMDADDMFLSLCMHSDVCRCQKGIKGRKASSEIAVSALAFLLQARLA